MCDFACQHPNNQHALAVRPILNAAKAYAAQGLYVFPLHSPIVDEAGAVTGCTCEYHKVTGYEGKRQPQPDFICSQAGKHPKIVDWENRATIDPDQIFKWFGRLWSIDKDRHGNDVRIVPNIGIACGKSGVLALDADSYKDSYSGLNFALNEECPTQISGGGGNHYIYRLNSDDDYNNSSNGLSEGIDIRAHGGLIVAAPSLHSSGNRYQWEMGYSVEEIESPQIPNSLRTILDTNITSYCKDDWGGDADDSIDYLQSIIDRHSISGDWNQRTKTYTLDNCPFSDAHEDGAYIGVVASGALYAGCHHSSCKNKSWKEFKEIYPMSVSREDVSNDLDGLGKEAARTWAIEHVAELSGMSEADREATYVRIAASAGSTWVDKVLRRLIDAEAGAEKKTVAQKLNELVEQHCTFYVNQFEDLMCVITGEHIKARSNKFNSWVRQEYYEIHGAYPGNDTVNHLKEHKSAQYADDRRTTYTRIANHEDNVALDLGKGNFVNITNQGWEVVGESSASFWKTPKMQDLAEPIEGGDKELLRKYINVTDQQWPMIQAWIAYALHGKGPFPILVLTGSAGSAKTSTSRRIRDIVDPQVIKDLSLPYGIKPETIMLSAKNGYVLAYDNISTLSREISDILCRIATGAGASSRQLYSDDDEVITVVKRPIILTGITEFVADKEDLLSRSLIVKLPRLQSRTTEKELDRGFGQDFPAILGGFLDLVSIAIDRLPNVELDEPPRMADFALFVKAIAPYINLDSDNVIANMLKEELEQQASVVYDSPVGSAVMKIMKNRDEWEGSATELLNDLKHIGGLLSEDAPTSRKIKNTLNRLENGLYALGVGCQTNYRKESKRLIILRKHDTEKDGTNWESELT